MSNWPNKWRPFADSSVNHTWNLQVVGRPRATQSTIACIKQGSSLRRVGIALFRWGAQEWNKLMQNQHFQRWKLGLFDRKEAQRLFWSVRLKHWRNGRMSLNKMLCRLSKNYIEKYRVNYSIYPKNIISKIISKNIMTAMPTNNWCSFSRRIKEYKCPLLPFAPHSYLQASNK